MVRRMIASIALVLMGVLTLVPAVAATGERAGGALIGANGATVGQVELVQEASGVRLTVRITDPQAIKAGNHGIHFHAVGKCDVTEFTSASSHFNPTSRQHGAKNPQGAHAGDLPNLPLDDTTRNREGGYSWTTTTNAITLTAGPTNVFDADGTALVIHADPDDEATDPTGNSGGRVACATIGQLPNLPNTGLGGMADASSARGLAALIGLGALLVVMVAHGLLLRRMRRS